VTALAVIYIACLCAFFVGVAASADRVFRGWPAAITFFGFCASGLALAAHAL
jgi:hypothetical protein